MGNRYSSILNLEVKRGEYLEFTLTVEEEGFDFSGWSAKAQVKNNYGDASAVASATITLGTDTATVKFPSTSTDIAEGKYWWDIMFTDPDGNNHYPREGEFLVKRRVTS